MTADGAGILEGNRNHWAPGQPVGTEQETAAVDAHINGFEWRGGNDRMTTGIRIWSEPFVEKTPSGQEVAILLIDTQGLFDHETPKELATQIFAVSTLVRQFCGLRMLCIVRIDGQWLPAIIVMLWFLFVFSTSIKRLSLYEVHDPLQSQRMACR